jgi:hypothetical protein
MTDAIAPERKTPGIVIFVAVLNFISTAFFLLLAVLAVMVLVFGNFVGIYDYMSSQVARYSPQIKLTLGVNIVMGLLLAVSAFFCVFHLVTGIGLLKGKKIFWYIQIALSVLGLLGFPIATILNTIILVFFFQSATRDYFKV